MILQDANILKSIQFQAEHSPAELWYRNWYYMAEIKKKYCFLIQDFNEAHPAMIKLWHPVMIVQPFMTKSRIHYRVDKCIKAKFSSVV